MNKEYLIYKLSDEVKNSCKIDKDAFKKFNVKRGLRNEDGSGVLVGLTNIGNSSLEGDALRIRGSSLPVALGPVA